MNRPSVARTCSHCEKPIPKPNQRAFFDGKLVGKECLRALAAEQAAKAAEAPARVLPKSGGSGLGVRLAEKRRAEAAEANAELRERRAWRSSS